MRLEEVAYFAADVDATAQFYQRLLGAAPAAQTLGQAATLQVGSVRLFFHQKMTEHKAGWPLRDEDHVSFSVADVDRACVELLHRGLRPEVGPKDFYWGRSAYFRDPDGRLVELHQTSSEE